jgi:hypothetical protein
MSIEDSLKNLHAAASDPDKAQQILKEKAAAEEPRFKEYRVRFYPSGEFITDNASEALDELYANQGSYVEQRWVTAWQ